MKITIFTPTYIRGYRLPILYNSLKRQTSKDFIWLIIDDGSTDNTYLLVQEWIQKNEIKIEYFRQENQGKSQAHNKGVEFTKTELFTCVDSDDYLDDYTVEELIKIWKKKENDGIIGILAFKGQHNGKSLTTIKNRNIKSTTLKAAYSNLGLKGDTMLIYNTEILSKYSFPKFKNEKFVPEAYLYDLLDKDGKLLLLRKTLYYCEYLEDGYTKNIAKLLVDNPNGYITFVNQRLLDDSKFIDKLKNTIRYTAMCMASEKNKYVREAVYPLITILTWPLGYLFYKKRYKSITKR